MEDSGRQNDDNNDDNAGNRNNNDNNNWPKKKGVKIFSTKDLNQYKFCVLFHPSNHTPEHGIKKVIKRCMMEMKRQALEAIFHLTNKLTKPKPKDICHVNSNFPNKYLKFVKIFYSHSTNKNV